MSGVDPKETVSTADTSVFHSPLNRQTGLLIPSQKRPCTPLNGLDLEHKFGHSATQVNRIPPSKR